MRSRLLQSIGASLAAVSARVLWRPTTGFDVADTYNAVSISNTRAGARTSLIVGPRNDRDHDARRWLLLLAGKVGRLPCKALAA